MSQSINLIEKYGSLTIEQFKNMNFQGQGQIQPGTTLWRDHVAQRGESILDALEHHPSQQMPPPEITITKTQYDILQRYHKREVKENRKKRM